MENRAKKVREFREKLKMERAARKFTQRQMADFLGVSEQTVRSYELGLRYPYKKSEMEIAHRLGWGELTEDGKLRYDPVADKEKKWDLETLLKPFGYGVAIRYGPTDDVFCAGIVKSDSDGNIYHVADLTEEETLTFPSMIRSKIINLICFELWKINRRHEKLNKEMEENIEQTLKEHEKNMKDPSYRKKFKKSMEEQSLIEKRARKRRARKDSEKK